MTATAWLRVVVAADAAGWDPSRGNDSLHFVRRCAPTKCVRCAPPVGGRLCRRVVWRKRLTAPAEPRVLKVLKIDGPHGPRVVDCRCAAISF